jgi:protein involved in polysaccharide export with SLBB domain
VAITALGFSTGTYSGGTLSSGVVVPVTQTGTVTPPDAFTINSDGTVTVNQAGTYLANGKVQTANGGQFGLQVNGAGVNVNYYNAFSTPTAGGTGTVNTILTLNAGDKVSIGLVSAPATTLATSSGGVTTPSTAITLYKVG